jgi:hypothetical protein
MSRLINRPRANRSINAARDCPDEHGLRLLHSSCQRLQIRLHHSRHAKLPRVLLEGFDALSALVEAFLQGFQADLQRDGIPVFEAVHDGPVRIGDPNGVSGDLMSFHSQSEGFPLATPDDLEWRMVHPGSGKVGGELKPDLPRGLRPESVEIQGAQKHNHAFWNPDRRFNKIRVAVGFAGFETVESAPHPFDLTGARHADECCS